MDASCVPVALLAVQWRLPKALDTPQRTSSRYKGRGKAQARAHPAQSPIAVGQPKPKAFLWVCCIHHGHQRHFQNEVCHLPSLWDGQTLLPFPPPLPYWSPGYCVPTTGRKSCFWQMQGTEKQNQLTLFCSTHLSISAGSPALPEQTGHQINNTLR